MIMRWYRHVGQEVGHWLDIQSDAHPFDEKCGFKQFQTWDTNLTCWRHFLVQFWKHPFRDAQREMQPVLSRQIDQ